VERTKVERVLNSLLERLAAIEHERCAHWQRHVDRQSIPQADGSLLLAAEAVARWDKEISTSYADLSEEQKETDRDQGRRYLPPIACAWLKRAEHA
jgi:hypothetical protein